MWDKNFPCIHVKAQLSLMSCTVFVDDERNHCNRNGRCVQFPPPPSDRQLLRLKLNNLSVSHLFLLYANSVRFSSEVLAAGHNAAFP